MLFDLEKPEFGTVFTLQALAKFRKIKNSDRKITTKNAKCPKKTAAGEVSNALNFS